jgi:hypothetical protein
MRGEAISEIVGSLIIVLLIGVCALGGLATGVLSFFVSHPAVRILGVILLLFGIENLCLLVVWGRQTASEIGGWSGTLYQDATRTAAGH